MEENTIANNYDNYEDPKWPLHIMGKIIEEKYEELEDEKVNPRYIGSVDELEEKFMEYLQSFHKMQIAYVKLKNPKKEQNQKEQSKQNLKALKEQNQDEKLPEGLEQNGEKQEITFDATCLFHGLIKEKQKYKKLKKDNKERINGLIEVAHKTIELREKINSITSYPQLINLFKTYDDPSEEEAGARLKRLIASINKQKPEHNKHGYIFRFIT